MKRALVLSGGGLFGAWQAGAWRSLADRLQPDLIVGASVGSLNGYAIAGGATPDQLAEFWTQPESANFSQLPGTIRALMQRFPLERAPQRVEYAVILTDLLRLKPRIFTSRDQREPSRVKTLSEGSELTWQHLAASCAIPGVLRQHKIEGRWYSDGGLLNPLPVWAAVELGATHIVALHALPQIPSILLRPFVKGFRRVAGHHPPLPPGVELTMISTGDAIGSMRDALRWKHENIDRWLQMGYAAAQNISLPKCYGRDCMGPSLER